MQCIMGQMSKFAIHPSLIQMGTEEPGGVIISQPYNIPPLVLLHYRALILPLTITYLLKDVTDR